LENELIVKKKGIKKIKKDKKREMLDGKKNEIIRKVIFNEMKVIYGKRKGCEV
jgi:hypothetical protein